ncbi:MAG: MBL fold metallo-hydrolase [Ruminococcaceae bacterium]|nr:MBL fold metallo-hydrolase [Oscillospiraceae bacterium]
MLNLFCKETENIYRLRVPFENIYTSVFLIISGKGAILVDCATTPKDVDEVISPALKALGFSLKGLRGLVLTHRHGDHAGGLSRILELAPDIEIITDIRTLFDGVCTYPLAGHTEDSIGILDERTNTLISGDGLQGAGVDKYRCYTKTPERYLETLKRIKNDERIENILFSHAYEPWNRDSVHGRKSVLDCLEDCKKYVTERKKQ